MKYERGAADFKAWCRFTRRGVGHRRHFTRGSAREEHGTGRCDPSALRITECDSVTESHFVRLWDCESASSDACLFCSSDSAPAATACVCVILLSC